MTLIENAIRAYEEREARRVEEKTALDERIRIRQEQEEKANRLAEAALIDCCEEILREVLDHDVSLRGGEWTIVEPVRSSGTRSRAVDASGLVVSFHDVLFYVGQSPLTPHVTGLYRCDGEHDANGYPRWRISRRISSLADFGELFG